MSVVELAASKPYLGLFVTPEKDKKSQNHASAPFDISLQGFLKIMKLKNFTSRLSEFGEFVGTILNDESLIIEK